MINTYTIVYDIVYRHRIITIVVNDDSLRPLCTTAVIRRKESYTIGVKNKRKQLPFFDVMHWVRSFTAGRDRPGQNSDQRIEIHFYERENRVHTFIGFLIYKKVR